MPGGTSRVSTRSWQGPRGVLLVCAALLPGLSLRRDSQRAAHTCAPTHPCEAHGHGHPCRPEGSAPACSTPTITLHRQLGAKGGIAQPQLLPECIASKGMPHLRPSLAKPVGCNAPRARAPTALAAVGYCSTVPPASSHPYPRRRTDSGNSAPTWHPYDPCVRPQ